MPERLLEENVVDFQRQEFIKYRNQFSADVLSIINTDNQKTKLEYTRHSISLVQDKLPKLYGQPGVDWRLVTSEPDHGYANELRGVITRLAILQEDNLSPLLETMKLMISYEEFTRKHTLLGWQLLDTLAESLENGISTKDSISLVQKSLQKLHDQPMTNQTIRLLMNRISASIRPEGDFSKIDFIEMVKNRRFYFDFDAVFLASL